MSSADAPSETPSWYHFQAAPIQTCKIPDFLQDTLANGFYRAESSLPWLALEKVKATVSVSHLPPCAPRACMHAFSASRCVQDTDSKKQSFVWALVGYIQQQTCLTVAMRLCVCVCARVYVCSSLPLVKYREEE